MDICLILEGTYPYVSGGVSSWAHNLILSQPENRFHLVCLLAKGAKKKECFKLPENVVSIQNVILQEISRGKKGDPEKLFSLIEGPLLQLQHKPSLKVLKTIIDAIEQQQVGSQVLLDSEASWKTLVRMYRETMGNSSFLDYFWSWRGLLAGFYSIILTPLPQVDVYHALCTGYAGLLLAQAKLKYQKPALLTEHGIYTTERRIEITAAEWLKDKKSQNLDVRRKRYDRDLKDFWIDTFSGYSKLAYEAADQIITLYEGNQHFQIKDGADRGKLRIIPNGVDVDKLADLSKKPIQRPTVAMIGRIVPIKDVKTFLRAALILKEKIPNIRILLIGPQEEDPDYYAECLAYVEKSHLQDTVTFTGKVKIEEWLPEIDVIVLTSISEAQPLVLLEGGACGIPSVATDVGSCREIILGRSDERPSLGPGGIVVSLANSQEVAAAVKSLLLDPFLYQKCSKTIRQRVKKYYNSKDQALAYRELYGRDWICTQETVAAK
jgi:glycosyltransferase involved in cell wall biosynthesis